MRMLWLQPHRTAKRASPWVPFNGHRVRRPLFFMWPIIGSIIAWQAIAQQSAERGTWSSQQYRDGPGDAAPRNSDENLHGLDAVAF